jgi:hypothetical protein
MEQQADLQTLVEALEREVRQLRVEQERQQHDLERLRRQVQPPTAEDEGTPEVSGRSAVRGSAPKEMDYLIVSLDEWDGMDLGGQLRLMALASRQAFAELDALPRNDASRRAAVVVICGRRPDGRPRVIHSADSIPEPGLVEGKERELGLRAWRLTRVKPREIEESGPQHPTAGGGGGDPEPAPFFELDEICGGDETPQADPPLPWADGVGDWQGDPPEWVAQEEDRYPQVRVRVRWAHDHDGGLGEAEFLADLDTGAGLCVLPLEELREKLGPAVTENVFATESEEVWHLGESWKPYPMRADRFRFEVHGRHGWMVFEPISFFEFVTTTEWDDLHALSQRRRGRRALVGRPIWRGKVTLTLSSGSADWENSPPTTG